MGYANQDNARRCHDSFIEAGYHSSQIRVAESVAGTNR